MMNIKVKKFIDETIEREGRGKFTDNPNDSGGATRWGITEKTARAYRYNGEMKDLPREVAESIYEDVNWIRPGFKRVSVMSLQLAEHLFDFGVLAGPGTSSLHLQRVLNVLNRNEEDWPDIPVDGVIGHQTINALASFVGKRKSEGIQVLIGMVVALQSVYLMTLAEARHKDEEFIYGWELNRAIGTLFK